MEGQSSKSEPVLSAPDPPPTSQPTSASQQEPPPSSTLSDQLARSLPPSARTLATVGLFTMALGAVLYLARVVFIPLTFALMLSFLLSPAVTWLSRRRIPRSLGSAVVVIVLITGASLAVSELSAPAAEWIERSPRVMQDLERKLRPFRRPVKSVSDLAERVERITQVDERKPPREVTLEKPGILSMAFDTVWSVAAGTLVSVFALYFMLLNGDVLLARLIAWVPDLNSQRRTADVIESIRHGMSRYLRTVFLINSCVGVVIGAGMYFLRMPNPVLWGALALLVNFVPYLGPFAGILTVGAVSLATFSDPTAALFPPLFYLGFTAIEGNVVTPLILGRTCKLDPLVIFVWLLFWGWLWGVPGAIVAVPLLMLIKLTSEKSLVLQPLATLLTPSSRPAPTLSGQ